MKALVWIYVALILVFTLYGGLWGDMAHQGFAYNFGRALFWREVGAFSLPAVAPCAAEQLGGDGDA